MPMKNLDLPNPETHGRESKLVARGTDNLSNIFIRDLNIMISRKICYSATKRIKNFCDPPLGPRTAGLLATISAKVGGLTEIG